MEHDQHPSRLRRSCLLVPGNAPAQLRGAGRFPADELILDVAGVAESEKDTARAAIIDTLSSHAYGEPIVSVRVNAIDTMWAYRDVIDMVERAGDFVDCVTIPDVQSPSDVEFVDNLLRMIEDRIDLAHNVGIEAQIATAQGLTLIDEIAIASDRLEALIFDAGGVSESLGITHAAGTDPHDPLSAMRLTVSVAARTAGLQVVDFSRTGTEGDAYRAAVERSRMLGYDGAWCTHPEQVGQANELFSAV